MNVKAAWSALLGSGATQQAAEQSTRQAIMVGNVFYGLNLDDFNDFIKKAYQLNDDVYSIVSMIANKVAEAPFVLRKVKSQKKYIKYKAYIKSGSPEDIYKAKAIESDAIEEITEHELLDILNKKPKEGWTGSQLKYAVAVMRLITGNAYVYGVAPDSAPGKFKELHLLPSQFTFPVAKDVMGDVVGYRLNFYPDGMIPKEEVCHIKYFNPDFSYSNPFIVGQSPLMAAAARIASSNAGALAEAKAFQNGGSMGVIYEDVKANSNAFITDDQRVELQNLVNQRIKGAENYKSLMVSNSPLGYIKIGDTPVDMDIINSGVNNMRKLCNIYHVRSRLFNDMEGGSYNNMREDRKAMITDAVMPELTAIEESFSSFLIEGWFGKNSGYALGFDLAVYPELNQGLKEVVEVMVAAWWLSPNKKNVAMDYPVDPDPLMDKVYIPNNLTPIDEAGLNMSQFSTVDNNPDDGRDN